MIFCVTYSTYDLCVPQIADRAVGAFILWKKIHVCEPLDENAVAPLIEKHTFQPGNSCVYDREHDAYTLEDLCLEMSAYGKGDIREPFVELIYEDGSFSSDFVYESSVRFEGREARDAEDALPASYDEKIRWNICV